MLARYNHEVYKKKPIYEEVWYWTIDYYYNV